MNTDKYTTYKCEACGEHKSTDKIHNISEGVWDPRYALKWYCRQCILENTFPVECEQCEGTNVPLYRVSKGVFCGPCLTETVTVQTALKLGNKQLFSSRLAPGEPEEDPDTDAEWKKLAEGAV